VRRLGSAFDGVCNVTSVILLWATVVVVFLQILSRYVFKAPLVWTEEVARFAFIWLVFLGVSVTERQAAHFRVTFLVEKASPRLRYTLWALVEVGIFATLSLLFFEAVRFTRMGSHNVSPVLQLRLDFLYMSFPAFVLLAIINRLRRDVTTLASRVANPFA